MLRSHALAQDLSEDSPSHKSEVIHKINLQIFLEINHYWHAYLIKYPLKILLHRNDNWLKFWKQFYGEIFVANTPKTSHKYQEK